MEKCEMSTSVGVKVKKQNKPFIDVRVFEPVTKKIVISSDSSELLLDYVSFLSSDKEKKITEDSVLDALILKLKEDKEFLKWRKLEDKF